MRRKSLRAAIALAVLCVGSGLAAQGSWAAPPAQKIPWSKCYATMGPFECGTLQVPLDYDEPKARRSRSASCACRQATRRTGSARSSSTPAARRLGRRFRRLRGSRPSSRRRCGRGSTSSASTRAGSPAARRAVLRHRPAVGPVLHAVRVPAHARGGADWMAADRFLVDACAQRGGAIVDHMSTANVARDMDCSARPSATRSSPTTASRTARSSARRTRTCSRELPGARDRRRARPDRVDEHGRRDPVLDAAAQRMGARRR